MACAWERHASTTREHAARYWFELDDGDGPVFAGPICLGCARDLRAAVWRAVWE